IQSSCGSHEERSETFGDEIRPRVEVFIPIDDDGYFKRDTENIPVEDVVGIVALEGQAVAKPNIMIEEGGALYRLIANESTSDHSGQLILLLSGSMCYRDGNQIG